MQEIKVIAFDADDTLWDNQVFYDEVESEFCRLLSEYGTAEEVSSRLFDIEMENMDIYKYGAKPFTLSMVEAAVTISRNRVPAEVIGRIVEMGKELLEMPIRLLGGVTEALETLKEDYKLVVATKGDLLDQERKLQRSGIAHYFDRQSAGGLSAVDLFTGRRSAILPDGGQFVEIGCAPGSVIGWAGHSRTG